MKIFLFLVVFVGMAFGLSAQTIPSLPIGSEETVYAEVNKVLQSVDVYAYDLNESLVYYKRVPYQTTNGTPKEVAERHVNSVFPTLVGSKFSDGSEYVCRFKGRNSRDGGIVLSEDIIFEVSQNTLPAISFENVQYLYMPLMWQNVTRVQIYLAGQLASDSANGAPEGCWLESLAGNGYLYLYVPWITGNYDGIITISGGDNTFEFDLKTGKLIKPPSLAITRTTLAGSSGGTQAVATIRVQGRIAHLTLEWSTDLKNWTTLQSLPYFSGEAQYTDSFAGQQRFYRARQ